MRGERGTPGTPIHARAGDARMGDAHDTVAAPVRPEVDPRRPATSA